MANEKVTFAKGNTPLPTDIIPGRLIVAEDTGDVYLDTGVNKRIQLKDSTKVSKQNIDNSLSPTSENPVQNKVIYNALDKKIEEPSGNGLVRKYMSGVYTTAGVDTTMPTSPTDNNIPTTKLLKDYVEDNTSNPLKLSDTNLQKSGLLIQAYTPAGSTPGTVGTRIYSVIERDVSTLDDTNTGRGKVPSSYVVGEYVKESVASKADISNPLSLSDTDKTKSAVLIQYNYDSETQTGKYITRSVDVNNLSESGLGILNIPTSKAVAQYVKNAINSAITMALNTEV